jgi:hypothetical protein
MNINEFVSFDPTSLKLRRAGGRLLLSLPKDRTNGIGILFSVRGELYIIPVRGELVEPYEHFF